MSRPPRDFIGQEATTPLDDRASSAPGAFTLLVLNDTGVEGFALEPGTRVTVGRAPVCEVCIAASSISRAHAAINVSASGVTVEDLGSANGVFVRGRRIAPNVPERVEPGDALVFGAVTAVLQSAQSSLQGAVPGVPRAIEPGVRPAVSMGSAGSAPPGVFVKEPSMVLLYDTAARVARSTISVLITGETGAGKESVAETVHRMSPRAKGPFVQINCAALAPSLIERELFGHEKGAYTGATEARVGVIESASGGTVFLDEAGELPVEVQAKLLRVLEQRQLVPVGGVRPRAVDVRFVSATNRDLRAESERGTFRRDLYFRLNGVTLHVPPLRERRGEIEGLARAFIDRAAHGLGERAPSLAPSALARLHAYRWPGNVRELRNVIEQAVLLCDGEIREEHLPMELTDDAAAPPRTPLERSAPGPSSANPANAPDSDDPRAALRTEMVAFERQRIIEALEKCGGNQTRAAEMLGVSRRTLVTKIGQYAIPRRRF